MKKPLSFTAFKLKLLNDTKYDGGSLRSLFTVEIY